MLLVILAIILTQLVGLVSTRNAQHDLLIEASLDTNETFARKIAQSASELLQRAESDLVDTAATMLAYGLDSAKAEFEAQRLLRLKLGFSLVAVHDEQGSLLAIVAQNPKYLQHKHFEAPGLRQLEKLRTSKVSSAFTIANGQLAIMLVQPLISPQAAYMGYISATVFLEGEGGLQSLVGNTRFRGDTQLLVIGAAGRLLYDSNPEYSGVNGLTSPVIAQAYQSRQSGQLSYFSADGIEFLAGYAFVPETRWLVLVQRSKESVLRGLNERMLGILPDLLVPTLLLMLLAWGSAYLIARPIGQLAQLVEDGVGKNMAQNIERVSCWYSEADSLQRALLVGVGRANRTIRRLRAAAMIDPMTKLGNRRGLEQELDALVDQGQAFAIIALDIDYFKAVNDAYGHAGGDQVLIAFASLVSQTMRAGDTVFRVGGEEFLVLMPGAGVQSGVRLAERLKAKLAAEPLLPEGQVLTMSAGVADCLPGASVSAALETADQALYRAKRAGRNRVEAMG